MAYIAAVDQGTSGTRAVVVDAEGHVVGRSSWEVVSQRPEPEHVEYDPEGLLTAVRETVYEALRDANCDGSDLAGLGVTGQRATTVVWDGETGEPVANAISWRDARTRERMESLDAETIGRILETTGLFPVSGYSASKVEWLLDRPGRRERARRGELLVGTLLSWLIYGLTGHHVVDVTDAAATMVCDVRHLRWDTELLEAFGIPGACLPTIVHSGHETAYGATDLGGRLETEVPVTASLGDQQAALLGHGCLDDGDAAYTIGSGGFLKIVTGDVVADRGGLVSTVACQFAGESPTYMLEAPIPAAGDAVEWLVEVGLLPSVDAVDAVAGGAERDTDTYVVPAFRGLGAPYWDESATGTTIGIDSGTRAPQIVRATLDAVAYRARDVLDAVPAGVNVDTLRIDGGLARSDYVCQSLADILGIPVRRSVRSNLTAFGAARAAGRVAGGIDPDCWGTNVIHDRDTFEPESDTPKGDDRWQDALDRARGWQS